jgi:hypothetical protein
MSYYCWVELTTLPSTYLSHWPHKRYQVRYQDNTTPCQIYYYTGCTIIEAREGNRLEFLGYESIIYGTLLYKVPTEVQYTLKPTNCHKFRA